MTTDTDSTDKVRENRLRRMAERQGLVLHKSRRRDPLALDFGMFQLVDADTNALVVGEVAQRGYGANLDEIEHYLTGREGR
jgi:hypothetical protein